MGVSAPLRVDSIHSALERDLIIDYLRRRGYQPADLLTLNPIMAKDVLTRACRYASLKLAEIEACSGFVNKMHSFTVKP